MIKLLRSGHYKLIETKRNTKILYLDNETYAWVEPATIGEILVISHNQHKTDCVLSDGDYHIYQVEDEPRLADHMHLELATGRDTWQGYLLLSGLPTDDKTRTRIIPTMELITGNVPLQEIAKPTSRHRVKK